MNDPNPRDSETDSTLWRGLDEPEAQNGLWWTTTEGWPDVQLLLTNNGNESGVFDFNGGNQPKQMSGGD